ncbi:uncharacterized protein LOC115660041 isoform X4 [Gopherus evgoodei]|uniref:uncharacterized protein LOC115660041 isoform X4 n=1 Tax=Gopherus evgoodei TaxID=1825980 RepID=UPI0011CF94D9|nr:uncharacterized protein LOC115660041 isoform X4 [Gopherus evgoodei]
MGHWMRGRRASWEWGARGFADPWISDFCVRPSPTLPDSGSLFVLQPGSQRLHGTLGRAGPQAGRRAKMKSGRAQAACLGPEQGSLESPTPGVQRLFPISLGSLQSLSLHGAGRKRASHGSAAWERGAELTMRHCNAPGKASTPSTTLSLPPSLARPIWLPRSFPGRSESVFTASQRSYNNCKARLAKSSLEHRHHPVNSAHRPQSRDHYVGFPKLAVSGCRWELLPSSGAQTGNSPAQSQHDSPVDTLQAAERGGNPEAKIVDEEVELEEDVEPPMGSSDGAGSQELFSTPEGLQHRP